MTLENLLEKGWTEMPMRGGVPITVPGAMHAWAYIIEKFGQLNLKRYSLLQLNTHMKVFQ